MSLYVCVNALARRHARIRKVPDIYKLPDKGGNAATKTIKKNKEVNKPVSLHSHIYYI